MKDKIKNCPKCKNIMKYRGTHIFFCLTCKRLYELTTGYWTYNKKKELFFKREKGWRIITKNGCR